MGISVVDTLVVDIIAVDTLVVGISVVDTLVVDIIVVDVLVVGISVVDALVVDIIVVDTLVVGISVVDALVVDIIAVDVLVVVVVVVGLFKYVMSVPKYFIMNTCEEVITLINLPDILLDHFNLSFGLYFILYQPLYPSRILINFMRDIL